MDSQVASDGEAASSSRTGEEGATGSACTVAVVVPFFQREPGILLRSLDSLRAQRLPAGVRLKVVVVDDESPVPAEVELASFALAAPHEIVMLRQSNGGPGAARNTALDSLDPASVEFVAFLDSDDCWSPHHLARALETLSGDADFVFTDHERWYSEQSWFSASEAMRRWEKEESPPFAKVQGSEVAFQFKTGFAFNAFLQDYLAQTSTVVYRFSQLPEVRFDHLLRRAGEDHMFWLDIASRARKVRFLREANVRCGEGVNIYYSSLSWDHPDASRRLANILKFFEKLRKRFDLSESDEASLRRRNWALQKMLAWVWTRRLLKTRRLDLAALSPAIEERRSLIFSLPLALLASIFSRPVTW